LTGLTPHELGAHGCLSGSRGAHEASSYAVAVQGNAWTRLQSASLASKKASHRPNLQFDILPDGDFRHDCRRFALQAAPAPGCCGAVVIGLRTSCSRGSGPPVDQRGQVFTPNQAWTAGILPYAGARFTASTDDLTARLHESALDRMGPPAVSDVALSVARIAATSGRPDQGRRPPAPRRRRVGVNCLSWASFDMSGGWLTRGTCRESLPRRASTSAVS